MDGREVNLQTVEVIESLHQSALKRIGCLLDENLYSEARQVADILKEVGII